MRHGTHVEAEMPAKRRRRLARITLETLRAANPKLDDEQGARAHLKPITGIGLLLQPNAWHPTASPLLALDAVVDALCGHTTNDGRDWWERASRRRVVPRDLQLFSLDSSAEMLAAAMYAGFFPFASEFACAGRPLAERGLLNLELAGPEVNRQDGDPGGRLVLDLSPGSAQQLRIGKRSIKKVRRAVSVDGGAAAVSGAADVGISDGKTAGSPIASTGTPYRLTVCAAFERSWEAIVAHHGVDWLGFTNVRTAYAALHAHQPSSPLAHEDGDGGSHVKNGCGPPRVLSIELWDSHRADELVSAEIGVLVGRCYTCLSLFARCSEYPRCDWVRAQATVLWLRRAGVALLRLPSRVSPP